MEDSMQSIKESAIDMIKKLPEDCSIEDIQYELYAKSKIEAGLSDVKNRNVISEKEMDQEINSWFH